MSKKQVDLIVSATWIVPVIPENRVLENCALIVHDGEIINIVPERQVDELFEAAEHIQLEQHVLLPGLINCHTHAAMSLLRGYADDKSLKTWLEEHIWPAEARWVSEEFVYDGTLLAIAEMLLSGTTCFSDMYFFPELAARAAEETGIRAQITFPIFEFASAWGSGPEDYIHKGLALRDAYRSHNRISIAFGPHAPYTVSDETFTKIATFAEELEMPIQTHLHETQHEVASALTESGVRPIKRLANLGLLSPLTQCVHMTQIDDTDIEELLRCGANVIHCPSSNMKLASGTCPTSTLIDVGINVALGSDGAASNNALSILNEMHLASLVAKLTSADAAAIDAHQAIRMATINGARALGINDRVGSLEKGKSADICAIDLGGLRHQPIYNPASQIVFTECSSSVTHVWINGRHVVKNRQLSGLSSHSLLEKVNTWRERITNE